MISKLDFTKDKLRPIIEELANLNGYELPSNYLNDLLKQIDEFNDFEFRCNFFFNIHYLCNENADKFWNEFHRQDITKWLKTSGIITSIFESTFTDERKGNPINANWFRVGLQFATGEMDELKIKFNGNATQIAKYLYKSEYKSYRPYISDSIGNSSKSDKNIFSSQAKLKKIKDYCDSEKILMVENFLKHLKSTI